MLCVHVCVFLAACFGESVSIETGRDCVACVSVILCMVATSGPLPKLTSLSLSLSHRCCCRRSRSRC